MNRFLIGFIPVVIVAATVVPPYYRAATAQPSPVVAPAPGAFVKPPGWDEAMSLIQNERTRAQGVQKLYALAAQRPKTVQAAQCLATAVLFDPDSSKAVQVYQSFITDYPGTGIEVQGRIGLLNLRWFSGEARGNNYLQGMDEILTAVGAPTLQEIRKNRGRALSKLRSLRPDVQSGLLTGYTTMHQILAGHALKRYREDLALCIFGLEAYSTDTHNDGIFSGGAEHDLRRLGPDPGPQPRVTTNPVVTIRSPRRNKSGPRPTISLEAYTGDYLHSQPNMPLSKILLDGQDIKPILRTRIKFASSLQPGITLETIRLKGKPVQRLSPGPHTLDITIQASGYRGGPGLTHVTQTFTVTREDRDCEDEDWDEDWGEMHEGER